MRLTKARVQNYRSIIDSGEINFENEKTILVGPNEAGKTVILRAIQQLNKPDDISGFDYLRDYPRAKLNDIQKGNIKPEDVEVVRGAFKLDEEDKEDIPSEFHDCQYELIRKLDNSGVHTLKGAKRYVWFKDLKKSFSRMVSHMDSQFAGENEEEKPSFTFNQNFGDWDSKIISGESANALKNWLEQNYKFIEEDNQKEEKRYDDLIEEVTYSERRGKALKAFEQKLPVFILFNNYSHVKPIIHLQHLAERVEQNLLDDEYYDYGNLCLLKLLGFTARELSDIGNTPSPSKNDQDALQEYRDSLDARSYQLNAASVKLTDEIKKVWLPNPDRPEADKLIVKADGQYLKVVVEDNVGVEIELDQRSEGFQWLVSFFVIFFSEAEDKHDNAILLLDEPGLSLHGLKQRDFRSTISRLAVKNQTVFTTHSPFLVGPDELDMVRVVEMKDRVEGTKVHLTISSSDPAGLLPLQEALGYDLAQSLFSNQRNLILEGITDYWYLEASAALLKESNETKLNDRIVLVFANSAGKVVYYATILHAHNLKVAALLDSDNAGDQAAQQENLVHTLGNKNILRTKDYCKEVPKAEIEDLLRSTLVEIAKGLYGKDVSSIATSQSSRPIIDIFKSEINNFSKYKLAKAYVRWTRDHSSDDLKDIEKESLSSLITSINKVLK